MTDHETTMRAWREILALARAEALTTYDTTYLELAVRRGLPLATKDDALLSAAKRLDVPGVAASLRLARCALADRTSAISPSPRLISRSAP